MERTRTALRYAKALFALAAEQDRLDAVAGDLADLRRLLDEAPEFRQLVEHPVLPPGRRAEMLRALLADRADPLTLRFLLFLVEKGRLGLFEAAAGRFEERYHAHRGIVKAHVESAAPLSAEQDEALRDRLGRRYGREVRTDHSVRPDLLGGFRVRIGDTLHDWTIRTQLDLLRKQWINAS